MLLALLLAGSIVGAASIYAMDDEPKNTKNIDEEDLAVVQDDDDRDNCGDCDYDGDDDEFGTEEGDE